MPMATLIARRVSSLLVALVLLSGCGGSTTAPSEAADAPIAAPRPAVVNALLYSALIPIPPDSNEYSWEVGLWQFFGPRHGITEHPASDTEPTGSLDGSTLAFQTNRDGNWEIYYAKNVADIIDVLPLTLRRLTDHPAQDVQPTLSPDGSKVAFVSDRGGGNDVYVQDLTGTHPPAKITDLRSATDPAWSPDGSKIAFTAGSEDTGKIDIYIVNVVGTELRRLTASSSSSEVPAWSPDGQRIAFQRGGTIWTMNSDGTDQVPFSDHPSAFLAHPAWSGDGRTIHFEVDCVSHSSCLNLGLHGPGIYYKVVGSESAISFWVGGAEQPAWLGSP